ncbi:7799_t:CDS:2 [Gigaspora rosea]|nr:7799_t:CDS:2 [Gigaspora rosea]
MSELFYAHYDSPGGKVEPDKPLNKAIQREVHEETGIDIDIGELTKKIKLVFSISGLSFKEYIFSDIFLNTDYYNLLYQSQAKTLNTVPLVCDNLQIIYLNIRKCIRMK